MYNTCAYMFIYAGDGEVGASEEGEGSVVSLSDSLQESPPSDQRTQTMAEVHGEHEGRQEES